MSKEELLKRLAAPFSLEAVGFKPQATNKEKTKAMMVTYIDARAVAERLDEVFPLAWQPTYEVMEHTEKLLVVMCRIHVKCGDVDIVRCDVGESDNDDTEASRWKSAVSDALKRAAVLFGLGRYVYDLPKPWVDLEQGGKRPTEQGLKRAQQEYQASIKKLLIPTPINALPAPTEPAQSTNEPEMITPSQLKALQTALSQIDLPDSKDRREFIAYILQIHPPISSKDLTKQHAKSLLDRIGQETPEGFRANVDTLNLMLERWSRAKGLGGQITEGADASVLGGN